MTDPVPFKAGQFVEAKSFIKGYRGAWFRCKIHNTRIRRGLLECYLEYSDFPDEKIKWTSIYASSNHNKQMRKKELLLRPSFPPFRKESEPPPPPLQNSSAEVTAVVNDAWRVGDLVDLWCDGCFWSAKIIKIYDVDTVEVELPRPPDGEGNSYKGAIKDLRPSLSWSLEKGWSVPISQANGETWCTARLVRQPLERSLNESDQSTSGADKASGPFQWFQDMSKAAPTTCTTSFHNLNPNSMRFAREKYKYDQAKAKPVATPNSTVTFNSISQFTQHNSGQGTKSMDEETDVLGEAIMELEEVATKIKWMKALLLHGPASVRSNDMRPSWKFVPGSEQ